MAFQKKTWLARLGQGLNKFIFNGGSKVTLDSSPDLVTQEGTPLSAENMNDLENRIDSEFTNVNDAITSLSTWKKISTDPETASYVTSGSIKTLDPSGYRFLNLFFYVGSVSSSTRRAVMIPAIAINTTARVCAYFGSSAGFFRPLGWDSSTGLLNYETSEAIYVYQVFAI